MNPNKKLSNPKSSQGQASPWLLCPSKSFPGKFYYFNGSTGETAWCLSETDKNSKKGPIHRVTDKAHTYAEPPIDGSTNTTNSFSSLKNTGTDYQPNTNVRPSPVFGQAVFPKYVPPDIFTPKFVWALTPMYVPSQIPHRQMLDQVTQTYEPEQPRFAQSVPSNSRFQSLKRPNFTPEAFPFQTSSPFQHYKVKPMFEQASNFKMSKEPTFGKPTMKDEACQTFVPIKTRRLRTQSESDSMPKSALKTSRSVENLTLLTRDVETSTLSPPKKVDNGNDKLSELDKNDLRFKLVAKKKKAECTVGSEKTTDQSKAPQKPEGMAKKHVTFDLQKPGVSHSSPEDAQETEQETDQSTNSPATETDQRCYVVADTETLLSEWPCIDYMIKNDRISRLLVPYAAFTELENRSRVDGAIPARQLLRKLAQDNVIVQSKPDSELPSEDSILECCWSVLQEDNHVILVTNNKNLLYKAKSIDLECYTADEIKMRKKVDSGPKFDLAKLKIIVENDNKKSIVVVNDKKKSENLFMQNLKDINGLSLRPNGFALRQSKLDMCKVETSDSNVNNKILIDNGDKLINLTRPKNKNENTVLNSEITNVKNQIVNLRITENSSTKNQTRQINKNVFWNAGLDTNDKDPSIDGLEKNNKQNFNEKHNVNKINQNTIIKPRNVEVFDEIDLDIRKLDTTENNQEKRRDNIKVSGITKLDNHFNMDENLARFYIKSNIMETRIKSRLEEWVCRLNQTMEGALTDLLLNEKAKIKKMMPPWNLFEALQVTGDTYKKQPNIKTIIDTFSVALLSCSSNNGKLKKDIKPNDFMKLIGFSVLLIEKLKEIVNCKELNEAEEMLGDLMKNIEDPKTDICLSLEKVNPPIFSPSDISYVETPVGYRKSRTEVMEYLKKHFVAWQSETDKTETVDDKMDKEPNILITCGKNLNTLKINSTKAITVDDKTNAQTNETNDAANNQPKVIRNVKIIDAFEERIKKRAEFNLDELDYEDNETVFTISDDFEVKSENPDTPQYDCVLDDLSVSQSIDTECVRAYPLAKIFVAKMKATLINIFNFINRSLQEYRQGMPVHKKESMLLKTAISRQYLMKIAERLKNIIARESSDGVTLKHLLIKAGDYVEDDPTMANYKQTVQKFLEQAQILEEVLEHMLSLFNSPSPKDSDRTNCASFNTTSPILPARLRSNTRLTNGS